MYAIVRTGGKQYRAEEGRSITVERLPAEAGETVELSDVLLLADDGNVTVGTPTVQGARVLAMVEEQGRGRKIIVFKYKAKVRTRKKTGHRQHFTKLSVVEIVRPGQEPKAVEKPKRRPKAAAEDEGTPVAEVAEAEAPEAAVAEAPAEEKPKRRTRRAKAPAASMVEAAPVEEPAEKPKRTRRKTSEEDPTG